MANAKNTIQNIPLTGSLNLNKLKTDVASFEGYNDKNTTVFGGELTNIYTKETELGNKDTTYTIFNSKGEPYTIQNGRISYNNTSYPIVAPKITDMDVPDDTIWCGFKTLPGSSMGVTFMVYIAPGKIFGKIAEKQYLSTTPWQLLTTFPSDIDIVSADLSFHHGYTYSHDIACIACLIHKTTTSGDGYSIIYHYLYDIITNSFPLNIDYSKNVSGSCIFNNATPSAFVSFSYTDDDLNTYINGVPFSGKKEVSSQDFTTLVKFTVTEENPRPTVTVITDKHYFLARGPVSSSDVQDESGIDIVYITAFDNSEGYAKTIEVTPDRHYIMYQSRQYPNTTYISTYGNRFYTGHDGNFFLPGIRTDSLTARYIHIYYINGLLYAASLYNRLIELPGVISKPYYYIPFWPDGYSYIVYRNPEMKWVCYSHEYASNAEIIKNLDKIIVDNRYVPIEYNSNDNYMLDIETNKIFKSRTGYVDAVIPVKWVGREISEQNTTGMIYATGANINYPISGIPFSSMIMNPKVIVNMPKDWTSWIPSNGSGTAGNNYSMGLDDIDVFYSMGDNVQSAKYRGINPEYADTVYPIDTNGNIMYPITWNSRIINGYSNNDLIKVNDTVYPLAYWNNNQKVYLFYLLSAMSNVTGAFALQGQQYTFDDKNIYNVQFSNGIIQSSTSVCYIENMQYLGTLPTSAIFYSNYNKTFYKFTGDNILSKMFEANDIDEIRMVGQNPSTLSLWISTDKGVYVLSDTDMFKLDYIPENIYFDNEKTILVSKGETNWIEDDISLYDIENGGTPSRIKLKTKYYGLGGEHKALYDCWYIRLHSDEKISGTITVKMNTITDSSFASNEETRSIEKSMYDENNQIYLKFQPKYQSGVAVQLELESDIPVYQISLGANVTDQVTQQAKFNF